MTSDTPKWLHRIIELREDQVIGVNDKVTVHDFDRRGCDDCKGFTGLLFGLAFGLVFWALIGITVWWLV